MSKQRHEERLAEWAKKGKPGSEPVQAATVILIRDSSDELETLMLRRNSKIAFGGMWVFPGGRVDADDRAGLAADDELEAARVAAVREAKEESGLDLGLDGLVAFSHWTPPAITPRRFLTWFFIAAAPATDVQIDHGEIHEHQWMSARDAMERHKTQEIELAPPTWVTLHALSQAASVEQALEAARAGEPERFETHIAVDDHGPVALWHGDAGYADSDAEREGARHRLRMLKDGWRYERND
jgi:8-oxo-dGTP pyrophosphatase MutT (NUDIX family)